MWTTYLNKEKSIAPLVTFRILFGLIMALSIIRFYLKGWIEELYIKPTYFFTFFGFDWIKPLSGDLMYIVYLALFLSALGIMVGVFYRFSTITFFILFTYVELIDKTNYLNHYYFVSLVSFLLILVPAHRLCSLDVLRRPKLHLAKVPAWTIDVFKVQLFMVYLFAGLAKINYDWMIEAMPMKLWLPALTHTPIIGYLFNFEWTAYLFSWSGALYDLTIAFFLIQSRTRPWAYLFVVIFHLMTALLFQIGMFPYIMILSTLIFFSGGFHEKILNSIFSENQPGSIASITTRSFKTPIWIPGLISIYFLLQLILPFRHAVYPGSVYWNEQGYRFSWRVMLMEKAGYTQFEIRDASGYKTEWVNNSEYLTPQQEKMMSTQPDMILQFAHHLETVYRNRGYIDPQIFCTSKVTLNGRRSQTFINPAIDLLTTRRGTAAAKWMAPPPDTKI